MVVGTSGGGRSTPKAWQQTGTSVNVHDMNSITNALDDTVLFMRCISDDSIVQMEEVLPLFLRLALVRIGKREAESSSRRKQHFHWYKTFFTVNTTSHNDHTRQLVHV